VTFAANAATQTVLVDVVHIAGFQVNRTFGVNLTSRARAPRSPRRPPPR